MKWALLLLVVWACTSPPKDLDATATPPDVMLCAAATACPDTVVITSLGVDGFLVRQGSSAVLTPPLFSHNGLLHTYFGMSFPPSIGDISKGMHARGVLPIRDVQMVLVGHSHYDHLMDVSVLVDSFLDPGALIVGSRSMKHLVFADKKMLAQVRVIDDPAEVGTTTAPGAWIWSPDKRWRVMPFRSMHEPNFEGITIAPGIVKKDYDEMPDDAVEWKLGEVYAFVVELMRPDGSTAFRFFFQDAVPEPKYNALPPLPPRDTVDVAIVVAGNFDQSKDYPYTLLKSIRPRRVIVGHWEDFFRPWNAEVRTIPLLDEGKLKDLLTRGVSDRWVVPMPGAVMRFGIENAR